MRKSPLFFKNRGDFLFLKKIFQKIFLKMCFLFLKIGFKFLILNFSSAVGKIVKAHKRNENGAVGDW